MRNLKIAAALLVAAAFLSGCVTARQFFGADDPCAAAENSYAAFLAIAATSDRITPEMQRKAASGIAGVRAYCAAGQVDQVTLAKLVQAYVAALNSYRS